MTTKFSSASCVFCREMADPSYARQFLGDNWPFDDRLVYRNESMAVVPGYGPQLFPYALIISVRHVNGLSQLVRNEREDILDALLFLADLKIFASNSLVVFEHGGCGGVGSCIDHFHLHVIDGGIDLSPAIDPNAVTKCQFSAARGLRVRGPYLFLGSYARGESSIRAQVMSVTEKNDQHFRKQIARELGSSCYDWREGRNMDYMVRLVEAVKERQKVQAHSL